MNIFFGGGGGGGGGGCVDLILHGLKSLVIGSSIV
jgi:hypothetical protein